MKAKPFLIPFLTLQVIIALFCSKKDTEWKGTIEEDDGVIIVTNPKEPMYKQDVLSLEEEIVLGQSKEREEPVFINVVAIQADSIGNIYVLDGGAYKVIIFNNDGEYIRSFGGQGQGPGEFQIANDIQLTPDNKIMILDRGNLRLHFFSQKGELLKEASLSNMPSLFRIYPDPDGNYTSIIKLQEQRFIYQIKKLDANLEEIALLVEVDYPRKTDFLELLPPTLIAAVVRDNEAVYGNWQQYKLTMTDATGRTIKEIKRDFNYIKMSEEYKNKIMERLSSIYPVPLKKQFEFPQNYPVFLDLSCDEQGRLFIETSEQAENSEGYYCDIFDEEGKYIAKILLDFFPRTWKNNKLYTIEVDEAGFQVVKRYKITWNY